MTTSIFWFRRDLRVHDNAALHAAVAASQTTFAVFCEADVTRLNARQRSFITFALQQLRSTLDKEDASLSILAGDPAQAIARTVEQLGASAVYAARSLDRIERAIEDRVRDRLLHQGSALHLVGAPVVFEPEAVDERKQSPGEGYRVFPPFYEHWKQLSPPRPLGPSLPNGRDPRAGALPDVLAPAPHPQPSETAAREALERFVTARAGDYGTTAEFPGRSGTSDVGAYLRFGLLSPRAVYHAVRDKMARSWTLAQERLSMEAFLRRLALRDFFIQLAYYQPQSFDEALQEKMRGFPASHDSALVQVWRSGLTGYPLVDAAMRQLQSQGHVHQRAAIVAASFAIADLGLDWRVGRDVWLDQLLEADEALCVGNWQRIAGIGSDQAAYPRIYNPIRQAQLFDSQATYVRRWCKELAKLPTRAALAPWEIDTQAQIELGFFTPQQYPARVVDHETVAREYLNRYRQYREQ